jgi:hypothetical protein
MALHLAETIERIALPKGIDFGKEAGSRIKEMLDIVAAVSGHLGEEY